MFVVSWDGNRLQRDLEVAQRDLEVAQRDLERDLEVPCFTVDVGRGKRSAAVARPSGGGGRLRLRAMHSSLPHI